MAQIIYGYEGKPIGENVDGKINWFYSDGKWGGEHGGHYMGTYEFLKFNHLM